MTTLNQEIISCVHDFLEQGITANEMANNVKKLFEKLIDEKMKRYEYKKGEITTDINEGYCRACRELKEELKK